MPSSGERTRSRAVPRIEVVRALDDRQEVVTVDLADGATVGDAIRAAGFAGPGPVHAGRFGIPAGLGEVLRPGDRVELYRPLPVDPKEARRRRVRRR